MQNKKKPNPAGPIAAVVLLLLLVVVLVFSVRSCVKSDSENEKDEIENEQETFVLSESEKPTESDKPKETKEPEESQEPSPNPSETPEPEETVESSPTPVPTISEQTGSFRSNTGMKINLVNNWTAKDAGNGNVKLSIFVNAESYSLNIASLYENVTVTVGDRVYKFAAAPINYGANVVGLNNIGVCEIELPLGENGSLEVPCEVEWFYNGVYDEHYIASISAEGLIKIS